MEKIDKLKTAEWLAMKDDKLCHWNTCKCIENNIELRRENIRLKHIEKKIQDRINELNKIINSNDIKHNHRHTLIEASIVKNELEEILKEKENWEK